ncbi:hypothetical protein CB1_001451019 [Camelus ferus]|nr:hypothetical protein CB1_001451019 [Camelus ferus]
MAGWWQRKQQQVRSFRRGHLPAFLSWPRAMQDGRPGNPLTLLLLSNQDQPLGSDAPVDFVLKLKFRAGGGKKNDLTGKNKRKKNVSVFRSMRASRKMCLERTQVCGTLRSRHPGGQDDGLRLTVAQDGRGRQNHQPCVLRSGITGDVSLEPLCDGLSEQGRCPGFQQHTTAAWKPGD